MMEVEDRHLNILVDLINGLLVDEEPLSYLSDRFSPREMVCRLAQLIIIYERIIKSDSLLILDLESGISDCSMSVCNSIRSWLLEYYKNDYVTLNQIKLENGVEEEVVLTTLMVLRVFYRMRGMFPLRFQLVLSDGWLDLHEFDEQLDEKFESRCIAFMTLLVKHWKLKNLEMEQYLNQITLLTEDKIRLEEKLRLIDDKYREKSVESVNNLISQSLAKSASNYKNKINRKNSNTTVLRFKTPSNHLERALTTTKTVLHTRNTNSSVTVGTTGAKQHQRCSADSKTIVNNDNVNNTIPTVNLLLHASNVLIADKSPPILKNNTQNELQIQTKSSETVRRTAPKLVNESADGLENDIFHQIQSIFNETDESELEYFDSPAEVTPIPKPISLPLKKRKHAILSSPDRVQMPLTRSKIKPLVPNLQQNSDKVSKTCAQWPSRKKIYPRKKRYPCEWPNCCYIADRPSTLVRHARAHTGEKPYKCDWPGCDKRYKMSSNLTPHKLTHTGEKPYRCDWPSCHKRFTYPQHLKRHRIAHQKRSRRQRTQTSRTLLDVSKRIHSAVTDKAIAVS